MLVKSFTNSSINVPRIMDSKRQFNGEREYHAIKLYRERITRTLPVISGPTGLRKEPSRPQPPYAADPNGRSQSPAGRGRIPSGGSQQGYPPQPTYAPPPQQQGYPPQQARPQVGHGRTSSGSGPQPRPIGSRPNSYDLADPPRDNRKSTYSSGNPGTGQPSIATLANAPTEGYAYPPPVRPQTGSRPTSQGSAAGVPPPTSQPSRPTGKKSQGLGPKTFQEMGVKTNHKKDSDCIVM